VTTIDTLVVEVTADGTAFRKGLQGVSSYAKQWASKMQPTFGGVASAAASVAKTFTAMGIAAGAAAGGGIALLVKQSLDATDAMAKLSDKTGIQIETLYGWQVAADDVGVELQGVTKMSQMLQRQISEAANGSKEAADNFKRLGTSFSELRFLTPEAALGVISDKLNNVTNQADKTALGMSVLGRGFMENSNFIKLGSEGMAKATERAKELGLTLSRMEAAKIEAVNDAFDELKTVVAGVGNSFSQALAPYILEATKNLVDASVKSGNFKAEIKSMVDGSIGALGWLLDVMRKMQISWLWVKAVFLEFSAALNSGLSFAMKIIHGTGVMVENFGSALMRTAEMGQSGLEVMWVAIKMAAAKSIGFMIDGIADLLFGIANVTFYTNKELGKSFENAALDARRAAAKVSQTFDVEMKTVAGQSAAAAKACQEAWGKALSPDASNTWSNALTQNADTAKFHAEKAWVELTALLQQPMPSEGIEQWAERAREKINEVAQAVADASKPQTAGSGETANGQEGGSSEFVGTMFNIGTLESDHKAYREVLAEKLVDIQTQRREFQANADLEMEALKEQHLANLEQQDVDAQARTLALWQSGWKGKAQIVGSILGQLSALQGSHSRKQFEVWKAAAIGETIVNTYSAAMGAYNAMSAIPVIGPALGIAAAAAAVAAGLANVQKISSTQFGGGGGGGAPTAPQLGTGTGANAPTGGDPGGIYGGGGAAKQITIQLQGDSMYSATQVRGLIDAINGQLGDGATIGSLRAT
jgi:hypothetical protein